MVQAAPFSPPDKAIVPGADTALRFRADQGQYSWLLPAGAEVKAAHAADDWRAQNLVDHDCPRAALILDREDCAVWQEGD